jgi:hypothetical protein
MLVCFCPQENLSSWLFNHVHHLFIQTVAIFIYASESIVTLNPLYLFIYIDRPLVHTFLFPLLYLHIVNQTNKGLPNVYSSEFSLA